MLLEKYEPRNAGEVIGNKKQLEEIRHWLGNWKKGTALIIHGLPGSGKSLAARLVARELCYELAEYSICNQAFSEMKEDILKTSKQRSLFFKGKIILIDEADILGSAKGMLDLIKKSEHPIILIAINPYEKKLAALRKGCNLVRFNKIRSDSIAKFLKIICEKEGIKYDENAINQLARMSSGDIRSALIDLEVLKTGVYTDALKSLGYREHKDDIFNTLKIIFRTSDLRNIEIALANSDKTVEEILMWLEENIPLEYSDPEEISRAYDYLSRADILASRTIKRQAFSLQKYYSIAAQGIAVSKKKIPEKYILYKVPKFFYSGNKAASEKIAIKLHISKREVDLYMIKLLAQDNPELLNKFALDEEEKEMIKNIS